MKTPQQFEDYHWYKYVVFADGQILFCEVQFPHTSLYNNGIASVGAGKIKHSNSVYSFDGEGSLTLNLTEACQDQVRAYLNSLGFEESEGEAFY